MIEQRLPVIARWMLYALGAVEGKRIRKPLDPVAAWLLKEHPGLLPTVPQPALLSTIRARTDIVDRMVGEEVHRARQRGERLAYWGFGGGFDARWFRLTSSVEDVVAEHREVEAPAILDLKQRLLGSSPFESSWGNVQTKALPEDRWTLQQRADVRPLVVLETGNGRLEDEKLRLLLLRIRYDAPEARVIAGIPPSTGPGDRKWGQGSLAALGWKIEEDVNIATRGRLMAPMGQEVCPGMYAFRIVRLSARELVQ